MSMEKSSTERMGKSTGIWQTRTAAVTSTSEATLLEERGKETASGKREKREQRKEPFLKRPYKHFVFW